MVSPLLASSPKIVFGNCLRKTTFSRSCSTPASGRAQGFAFASHSVPIAQAIFHQETDMNYQRLFKQVDRVWQASAPDRTPLAQLDFQLHKDFKKEIESARLACFPRSRACDDFFIGHKSSIRLWLQNVTMSSCKAGSG